MRGICNNFSWRAPDRDPCGAASQGARLVGIAVRGRKTLTVPALRPILKSASSKAVATAVPFRTLVSHRAQPR
jgi:hypothetical protein